jgi:pimeloyl-ACP methyl ester carboxylesterase
MSFGAIAPALAREGRQVIAVDLRGRGWSSVSARGTHGWWNHAADLLHVADVLGANTFDLIGHSMGAFVGMKLAWRARERVRRLVLIDAAGTPEPAAMPPIVRAVERLGAVYPDADAYIAMGRGIGTISPWNEVWDAHYRYDLVDVAGGVRARTDRDAVLEDVQYATSQRPSDLWHGLAMRTLLVRAARPLGDAGGFIVSAADRERFVKTAARAEAVDIDANHYGVMTHADTLDVIRRFLS